MAWGSLFLCPFPVHRQAEGAQRARVTRLPSIKVLEKELSRRRAVSVALVSALSPEPWSSRRAAEASLLTFFPSFSLAQGRTLSARSLETLIEGQAKVRTAAFPLPLAVPECRGSLASGVTFCGRVPRCQSGR